MKVRELMSSPAYTCRPQDPLASAARLMWEHDCGMLPVVDPKGAVVGVITDRDVCMGAYTTGRTLSELPVGASMAHDVVTCRAEDDLVVAVQRMTGRQLHRLPVVDRDGRPVGVLSLNDLVVASEHDGRTDRATLDVLRAACRRRAGVPAVVIPAAPSPATPAVGRSNDRALC